MISCFEAVQACAESAEYRSYNFSNCHNWPELIDVECALANVLRFSPPNEIEQAAIRKNVDWYLASRLLIFAFRTATYALRENDPLYLRAGVFAISLDPGLNDMRDVYATLTVLRDASRRLTPPYSIDEAMTMASRGAIRNIARLMTDGYPCRPEDEPCISSMGIQLTGPPGRQVYSSAIGLAYKNDPAFQQRLKDSLEQLKKQQNQ